MAKTSESMEGIQAGQCKESSCEVLTKGKCYEGLADPSQCSNFAALLQALENFDTPEDEKSDPPTSDSKTIDLYGGFELDYKSCLRLTTAAIAKVVAIAGPNDSGKTTLLVTLYESFLNGSFANYLFAGSDTLLAFERRCFLSRVDSGSNKPDTERTKSSSEQTMLHLCLRPEAGGLRTNLLISDIRGELFSAAIRSTTETQQIKILKRADVVAIVLDGEKLADITQRHQVAADAKTTMRSFLEANMIDQNTAIQFIFSKSDWLKKTQNANALDQFLLTFEEDVRSKFALKVRSLVFHRVAARPEPPAEQVGVDELLKEWLNEPKPAAQNCLTGSQIKTKFGRCIDSFGHIVMPEKFVMEN
jgi:hypothetical protein